MQRMLVIFAVISLLLAHAKSDVSMTCLSSSSPPGGRFGVATFVGLDGTLYLFGSVFSNDMWKYNISTQIWTIVHSSGVPQLPPGGMGFSGGLPAPRYGSLTWTSAKGIFYLFGGQTTNGILGDFWSFDPSHPEAKWTWISGSQTVNYTGVYNGSTGQPGSRANGGAVVTSSGTLWLFGGFGFTTSFLSAKYLNDLWAFDVNTNTWKLVFYNPFPAPGQMDGRAGFGIAAVNDFIWLFGGIKSNGFWADLWVYVISANQWLLVKGSPAYPNTPNPQMGPVAWWPTPRAYGVMWNIPGDSRLWIMNGQSLSQEPTDLWSFDIASGAWTLQGDFGDQISGRYEFGYWVSKNVLWMFGGFNDVTTSSDLWKIDVYTPLPPTPSTTVCGLANEGGKVTLVCPADQVILQVDAFYGNPEGQCGNYFAGSCNATNFGVYLKSRCLGEHSCATEVTNNLFGDPCPGSGKYAFAQAVCGYPTGAIALPTSVTVCGGPVPTGSFLALECPRVTQKISVDFANYGVATGTCGQYNSTYNCIPSTPNETSEQYTSTFCSGNGCTLYAGYTDDPELYSVLPMQLQCPGTYNLIVQLTCI